MKELLNGKRMTRMLRNANPQGLNCQFLGDFLSRSFSEIEVPRHPRSINSNLLFLFLFLFLFSCKKDEPQILDPVPYIEIVSVTPTTLQQFSQKIRVTFSYDDQDGDLGFPHPDSLSLSALDSRLAQPDYYHIPPLTPNGDSLHIRGNIVLDLQSPFLLGAGTTEIIHYTLKLKDRAGNWSNEIVTPNITITQ